MLLFDQETIDAACGAGNDYDGLWNDPLVRGLFGTNETALVRTADAAFALTDGVSVVYVTENPLSKTYAPQAWPFAVDPRFGIARVLLASGATGLFGCVCEENPAFNLTCAAIAGGAAVEYVVPAVFSLAAETQLLTCDRTRINVESLRWQQPRAAVAQLLAAAMPSAGAPAAAGLTTADVAVWVTPICGAQDGRKALACLPSATFTRGICMPYCLGVRLAAEGFGRPLTLRGAAEWTGGVLLTARDCTPPATGGALSAPPPTTTGGAMVRTVCAVTADVAGAALPQTTLVAQQQEGAGANHPCVFTRICTTFVDNRTALAHYADGAGEAAAAFFASEDTGARLVLPTQPLIIGGGTCVAQQPSAPGAALGALSLVGNTQDEFIMESPSAAPTPAAQLEPWVLAQQAAATHTKSIVDMPPTNVQANGAVPINPATFLPDGSLM